MAKAPILLVTSSKGDHNGPFIPGGITPGDVCGHFRLYLPPFPLSLAIDQDSGGCGLRDISSLTMHHGKLMAPSDDYIDTLRWT